MDDTQIIALYFSRSEASIAETAQKYGPYLNQIAYNILGSAQDAEEIVTDTYFAAWNTIPPNIPRVLRHYLSRITRNLSFDRLDYLTAGRRNSHMNLLLSELDACIPDRSRDLDATMEAKQIRQSLNRFLSRQDSRDCRIFLCRYYHCMHIRQISETYNLPERHIKYRLSCMRRELRSFLKQEGITV